MVQAVSLPRQSVLERLRESLGVDVQEVPGATVTAEIPLATGVINRLVATWLARRSAPITSATVQPREGNTLIVHVRLRGPRLLPTVRIAARIEQQAEFPHRPVIGFRWSLPGLGPLALVASPLIAQFKSLPRAVHIEGDWLSVNVHELMRDNGLDEVIPYLAGLKISTLEDRVVIGAQLRT